MTEAARVSDRLVTWGVFKALKWVERDFAALFGSSLMKMFKNSPKIPK